MSRVYRSHELVLAFLSSGNGNVLFFGAGKLPRLCAQAGGVQAGADVLLDGSAPERKRFCTEDSSGLHARGRQAGLALCASGRGTLIGGGGDGGGGGRPFFGV